MAATCFEKCVFCVLNIFSIVNANSILNLNPIPIARKVCWKWYLICVFGWFNLVVSILALVQLLRQDRHHAEHVNAVLFECIHVTGSFSMIWTCLLVKKNFEGFNNLSRCL